jgi:hypothetical protein
MMESVRTSETLVYSNKTTKRYVAEGYYLQTHYSLLHIELSGHFFVCTSAIFCKHCETHESVLILVAITMQFKQLCPFSAMYHHNLMLLYGCHFQLQLVSNSPKSHLLQIQFIFFYFSNRVCSGGKIIISQKNVIRCHVLY